MRSLFCLAGMHPYQLVEDTGKHQYRECPLCHKRIIREMYPGGYQPIDREWLAGGEFLDPSKVTFQTLKIDSDD